MKKQSNEVTFHQYSTPNKQKLMIAAEAESKNEY